jgi:hypothetical protein
MNGNKVLTRNTIIGGRIYPAGTPLADIPKPGFLVETMVTRPVVTDDIELNGEPNLDIDPSAPIQLNRLNLGELQDMAKTRGVKVSEDATRKQIIAALEAEG